MYRSIVVFELLRFIGLGPFARIRLREGAYDCDEVHGAVLGRVPVCLWPSGCS